MGEQHHDVKRRESHQLPEEAPAEQVLRDDEFGDRPARFDAEQTPGVPGEAGQASGHPPAPDDRERQDASSEAGALEPSELIARVGERAACDSDTAARACTATMATLAERIGSDNLLQVASRMPADLRASIERPQASQQSFSADEFVRRVSEREQVSTQKATHHAAAVLATLRQSDPGLARMLFQLPDDYRRLRELA